MYLALQNDGHENDQKENDYDMIWHLFPKPEFFSQNNLIWLFISQRIKLGIQNPTYTSEIGTLCKTQKWKKIREA